MRQSGIRIAICLSTLVVTSLILFGDETRPVSENSELVSAANPVNAVRLALPQTLVGEIQDRRGGPVVGAKVALWLIHETNPFEESGGEEAVKWTASTDVKGRYTFMLEKRVLEPDDEIRLVVQADGFLTLNSSIDPQKLVGGKLSAQQLKVAVKEFELGIFYSNDKELPASSANLNPWDKWKDDTDEFNEQVAATVNGVPILKKQIMDRYSGYLIGVRKQMQNSAKEAQGDMPLQTPDSYREYREKLLQKEIPFYLQKIAIVQFFETKSLTPEQRRELDDDIEAKFTKAIERLKKELNASNLPELEVSLSKLKTSLTTIKDNLAIEAFLEFITVSTIPYDTDDFEEILEQNEEVVRSVLNRVLSNTKIETKYRIPAVESDECLTELMKVLRVTPDMADRNIDSADPLEIVVGRHLRIAAAYAGRGLLNWRKGRFERALADHNEAIRLEPTRPLFYVDRGRDLQSLGRWDEAIKDFDYAVQLDREESSVFFVERARALSKHGDTDRAIADLDRAILIQPDVSSLILRGWIWQNKMEFDKALADFEEAICLNAKCFKAYSMRGHIWIHKNFYERAIEDFSEAIRLNSPDKHIKYNRGVTYMKIDKYEEALADFNDAVRLDPAFAASYPARGYVLKRQGNYAHAYEDLSQAIHFNPGDPKNYDMLSRWLATVPMEQFRDGIRAVELATKACELTEWHSDSFIETLACALAESGDFESAIKRLEQAMEMAPNSRTVKRAKMLALFRDGQPYRDESIVPSQ